MNAEGINMTGAYFVLIILPLAVFAASILLYVLSGRKKSGRHLP